MSTANESTSLLPPRSGDSSKAAETGHFKHVNSSQFWWLFSSIILVYLLAYFDSSFMASAHPTITSYFEASNAASWLSTVFYLTSTVFGPFYGRISDIFGRRPVYVFSMVVFGLSTAWCGAAGSIGSFIAARLVCGIGAGGLTTMANIILSDTVKVRYRGIYQSYLNIAFGGGQNLGASLSGLLVDRVGWRMAFYGQVPLVALLIPLATYTCPPNLGPVLMNESDESWRALKTFDFQGAIMLTLTLSGLILGINIGGNILPWSSPVVVCSLIGFLVAGMGLCLVEKKALRPLLPLHLLFQSPIGNLNWANLCHAFLTVTVLFNVPLFLQAVKQVSPTMSGLVLLAPLVGITVTSVTVGFFIAWSRKLKVLMNTGVILALFGIVLAALLQPDGPVWHTVFMIPWVSIGQGFFFPASTVGSLALSSEDEQAVAVTTLTLSRSLGTILGVAVSSGIYQALLPVMLEKRVTGDAHTRSSIIRQVRRSVKSIAELDPPHRREVIQAYSDSLRIMFATCSSVALISCILILPAKIEDLPTETDGIGHGDVDGPPD